MNWTTWRRLVPCVCLLACFPIAAPAWASDAVNDLLMRYRQQGAGAFDAVRGRVLWQSTHVQRKLGRRVSCTTCHTNDPRNPGQHVRTGKEIEPMAPSVSPGRLSDTAKIEKWFRRNCRWTWGRICTPQEKGDILIFLGGQ